MASRKGDALALLRATDELDAVVGAAAGKLVQSDVPQSWLKPLAAPRYGVKPSPLLVRWAAIFGEDYETACRARNNIVHTAPISDENLAAAAKIAERILGLVKNEGRA